MRPAQPPRWPQLLIWLWLKKPVPKMEPWQVEIWTKTCGLPLLFNFEPHPSPAAMMAVAHPRDPCRRAARLKGGRAFRRLSQGRVTCRAPLRQAMWPWLAARASCGTDTIPSSEERLKVQFSGTQIWLRLRSTKLGTKAGQPKRNKPQSPHPTATNLLGEH